MSPDALSGGDAAVVALVSSCRFCLLQLMVRAFDGGEPPKEDNALVTVTVNQNLFDPTIESPNALNNYQDTVEILETRKVNSVFYTVVARDNDVAVR